MYYVTWILKRSNKKIQELTYKYKYLDHVLCLINRRTDQRWCSTLSMFGRLENNHEWGTPEYYKIPPWKDWIWSSDRAKKQVKLEWTDGFKHGQTVMTLIMRVCRHEKGSRLNRAFQRRIWEIQYFGREFLSNSVPGMVTFWELMRETK